MNPANESLRTSAAGLAFIEHWEGLRLAAYLDGNGIATIGTGHTGKLIHLGMTCTTAQATAWLADDVVCAESAVRYHVNVPLVQGQFDALVDFTFNVGCGSLSNSTLLGRVNAQVDAGAIAAAFNMWVMVAGKVSSWQTQRRAAEAAMYNGAPQ